MGEAISSFAIREIAREAEEALKGGIFEKAQQTGRETFKLSFKAQGKKELIIDIGKRFNITQYRLQAPQKVSSLAMLLRKSLSGKAIKGVRQHGFDRVVTLDFGDYSLILELFSHGNMVFADSDGKIIFSFRKEEWKDRSIRKHAKYEYPKQGGFDPYTVSEAGFAEIFVAKDIVRSLAKNANLSGPYAEEICHLAGVDKHREKPSPEEMGMLFRAMKSLIQRKKEPVMQDNEVRPFPLASQGPVAKKYGSMNEAVDDFYLEAGAKESPALVKLRTRLAEQEKSVQKFNQEIEENKAKAELLKQNYPLVSAIIAAFKRKEDLSDYGARKEKDKIVVGLGQ